jgi:hypothetical protein
LTITVIGAGAIIFGNLMGKFDVLAACEKLGAPGAMPGTAR